MDCSVNVNRIGTSVINNYTWLIRQFSCIEKLAPKPQCLHSPQWTCNACVVDDNGVSYIPVSWRVKLHPNGNAESVANNISCYLETIFPGDAQTSARVNVNFYIGFYVPVQQGERRTIRLVKRRSERHDFLKVKPAWGWPNFCSKTLLTADPSNGNNNVEDAEALLPPKLQYSVEDDTLIVHVVIITPNPGDDIDDLENQFAAIKIRSGVVPYAQTLNNSTFSDIKFSVEGRTIHAHQVILAERSHYFKTLIKNDWKQEIKEGKPVTIEDVDYDTFHSILYYLYAGRLVDITGETQIEKVIKLQKLFKDADLRKTLEIDAMHELIEMIFAQLASLIDMDTWDMLLRFSWDRDIIQLRRAVYRFARRNWNIVRESEAFKDILRDANVDLIEEFISQIKPE
ncbi:8905_t:CDS:1 [Paraglomus occultum]|uniref:8905_t:CDS:1 n=1 Tax=Paraglomus occultum TaxID=144539 RepID=A0A9N8WIP1_9GLOM|nr:8905_t:CDS:1 [Paraglomus occultum]